MFSVPHIALGAELTPSHHQRTRVFAYRHIAASVGFVLCAAAMFALTTADVPTVAVVPIALPLSRLLGKKTLWAGAMGLSCISFGLLFSIDAGDFVLMCGCGIGAGVGGGIGAIVGPSLQADVIDVDELATGERKEGAYFAAWNFVRKCASGITAGASGVALQFAGFEPNVEQSRCSRPSRSRWAWRCSFDSS